MMRRSVQGEHCRCKCIADGRELVNYQGSGRRHVPPPPPQPAGPPVMSSGGKAAGLSFDLVLQKLQGELAKSKETGAELQGLATAMSDIQETLGGGLVCWSSEQS